jgi:hypothetical protein
MESATQSAVCAGWEPIYFAPGDKVADATIRKVVGHDEYGVKMGCWKAPVTPAK